MNKTRQYKIYSKENSNFSVPFLFLFSWHIASNMFTRNAYFVHTHVFRRLFLNTPQLRE